MKKLIVSIIFLFSFMNLCFSQSYIGQTKKLILNEVNNFKTLIKIDKPKKSETDIGFYSIHIKFQYSDITYSFDNKDLCYFYIVSEKYTYQDLTNSINYNDDKYLRAFDDPCNNTEKKSLVWKEWFRGIFVYRWIVVDTNYGIKYTIYLTQKNYENNKNLYIKDLLSN